MDPKSSALVGVSGFNGGKFPKREDKFANVRCNNCGNLGHTPSHCWGKNVDGRRPPNPKIVDPKAKTNNVLLGEHKVETETIISEKNLVCLNSKLCESNFPNMRSARKKGKVD